MTIPEIIQPFEVIRRVLTKRNTPYLK